MPDIDAHCFASLRIIPNRLESGPKGRFQNQVQEDQGDCKDDQDKVVRAVQRKKERGYGDTMDTIIAACETIPTENNRPKQRAQRNLEHGKIKS